MIVNFINLEARSLRREQFYNEASIQGFETIRFEGEVFPHDPKQGICRSHKRIVQFAKDNRWKQVLVCEDDVRWFGEGAFDYFISHIPEGFDLYLAMVYVGELDKMNRIKGVFSGMSAYVVHERFYDFFLSIPDSAHIDRELGLYSEHFRYIVCNEFCCEQDGSKSDNNKMSCDYRPFLEGRKLYNNGERIIYPLEQPL